MTLIMSLVKPEVVGGTDDDGGKCFPLPGNDELSMSSDTSLSSFSCFASIPHPKIKNQEIPVSGSKLFLLLSLTCFFCSVYYPASRSLTQERRYHQHVLN